MMVLLHRVRRLMVRVTMMAAVFLGPAASADPFASDWNAGKQSAVRLLADPVSSRALRLGLQFRLEPGWKTYWRTPGDAGLPASVDWSGSRNLVIDGIDWPAPQRYSLQGFESFGYEGGLILPVRAHAADPSKPVHVGALIDYLVCRQVCLPTEARLAIDLPAGSSQRPWRGLLDAWAARVPMKGAPGQAAAGVVVHGIDAGGTGAAGFLDLALSATPPLRHPDVMVEGLDIGVPAVPTSRMGDQGETILHLPVAAAASVDMARYAGKTVTVTVVDPPRALEVVLTMGKAVSPPSPTKALNLAIVLTALLGGFILNFMPCVLPVLSIKVLAVARLTDAAAGHWRAGFLASAAGIVTTFLALAALLAAGKEAGMAMGWGIQFQQPVFLAALAAATAAFAANLFGLFEIPAPRFLARWLTPRGQAAHPVAGSFATGVLATVMATPCSAPFLGTAVGFGLGGDTVDLLAIFLCLGLGLAAPYLLLAALPRLGRHLPRPGRWMLTLRRLLGLPLLATTIWLVSVIAEEAGDGTALVIALLAAAALAGLMAARRGLPASRVALLLFLAMPGVALVWPGARPVAEQALTGVWQPFDEARIGAEVAAGRVVFVDVTARWCLTCQANEVAVLDKEPVRGRLAASRVVAMRADWTRPDPRIAGFLQEFQRFGIPLYVVYGPGVPGGRALPEIVTPGLVLAALDRAQTPDPH
jgi:suppressor for copper-sensitivity B